MLTREDFTDKYDRVSATNAYAECDCDGEECEACLELFGHEHEGCKLSICHQDHEKPKMWKRKGSMVKVVINRAYGGFILSDRALSLYSVMTEVTMDNTDEYDIPRDDENLVKVVEMLGKAASDMSVLKVVEIPSDVMWEIIDYDGMEHVAELHRTWC
jgi:hypothetical protein